MPTYDYSGERTLKAGPDIFLPHKRTISKQFVEHPDLTLVSVLPAAQNIPFGNVGRGRKTVRLIIDQSGEVPIGPYADEFILQGNGSAVTISGEVRINGFSDGSRVTLRGASGEYTVKIKNGDYYRTKLQGDITLNEGDILELEYIRSTGMWAQVVYQPY